jgi:hypothetical protein
LKEYEPKQALILLVKELCSQLDDLATLKKKGYPGTLSSSLLRETAAVLPELPQDMQELYFEYLATFAECLCPPVNSLADEKPAEPLSSRKPKLNKAMRSLRRVA